ncbi:MULTISPECIES: hypothetical protein [Aeromonas]|uniref:hypothetical protein n=1 Tax=Aeromonas TaxID=642 RepID=UPI00083B8A63|nr:MULTISPECIES: hypothetical protein [Aeromonas]
MPNSNNQARAQDADTISPSCSMPLVELIDQQIRLLLPLLGQRLEEKISKQFEIKWRGQGREAPHPFQTLPAGHIPPIADHDQPTPANTLATAQSDHEESYQMLLAFLKWLCKKLGDEAAPDYQQLNCEQLTVEISKLKSLLQVCTDDAADLARVKQAYQQEQHTNQVSQAKLQQEQQQFALQAASLAQALQQVERDLSAAQQKDNQWQQPLQFMAYVKQQSDLAQLLLPEGSGEQAQKLGFIAMVSQWDSVVELWLLLERRCKKDKRPCNEQERALLEFSVHLYNLTLRDLKSELLRWPQIGAPYDYDIHNGVTSQGSCISNVWLPSLFNGGGSQVKKALVERG